MNCLFTGRWGYNWVVGGGGVFKEEVYGMRARVKMHTCKEGNMLCEKRKYFLSFLCFVPPLAHGSFHSTSLILLFQPSLKKLRNYSLIYCSHTVLQLSCLLCRSGNYFGRWFSRLQRWKRGTSKVSPYSG